MIFKKSKEETATERQLKELDELIDATEATSDEYPDLLEEVETDGDSKTRSRG